MKKLLKTLFIMSIFIASFSITAQAKTTIPKGAGYYNGHAYFVYPSGTCASYEDAIKFCKQQGGYLVTINNKAENTFVYNYAVKNGYGFPFIGYYEKNNKYVWANGATTTYTNWAPYEPEGQGYARYKNHGEGIWCDDHWNGWDNSAFVCEWNSKLTLSDTQLVLNKQDSTFVTYSYQNAAGKKIDANATWKTSNKNVAKVSSKGKIVAVNAGTCKITCTVKGVSKKVTVIVKPSKVKNIKTLSKSKNFIQLQWGTQTGVTKYQIYMYDKDLEEYTRVKTVNGNIKSARITNLKKNTQYKFKIRAFVTANNKNYFGAFSNVYKVKTAQK